MFYNTLVFNRVTPAVTQVGSYSISLVNGQVQVNQGFPDQYARECSPLACSRFTLYGEILRDSCFFDNTAYDGGRRDGSTIIGQVDKDGAVSGYGLVTGFTY